MSRSTLIRALSVLREQNWVEVRQIGANGTTNAYIINDRVAWTGARDGIRYSMFSAAVILSDNEQPDQSELGQQQALTHIPSLYPGERQLPTDPVCRRPLSRHYRALSRICLQPGKREQLSKTTPVSVIRRDPRNLAAWRLRSDRGRRCDLRRFVGRMKN